MRFAEAPAEGEEKITKSLFTYVRTYYSNAKVYYVTKKSTTMKRLFGVKKTIEAPSLEDTTSKVRLLSRALSLSLSLSFSLSLSARARSCACVVNLGWVHLN